ncbi:MAG: Uma2 family endonuclease [Anaerolineae bacterium]|nr:Uma2 family endonuclease [Anaerolineae bacterium]
MTDRERLYTAEEFEQFIRMPENRARRLELIEGEIVERAMPTEEHGTIVQNLSTPIHLHLKSRRLGRGGPEIRCRPVDDPHITLVPDWSFRLGFDVPVVTEGAVLGMPDFAVEVQSPDEPLAELRKKAMIYLRGGSRLVWLVLPRQRVVVLAFWADGTEEVYTVEDVFDFGALLTGFTLAIRDVFGG